MAPRGHSDPHTETEAPRYAGRYRLHARLGSGGMGVVHLARSASGMALAVKVVHPEFARDPEFRDRFRQEVAAARRVSGAFTAPVVDADPDAERPWMATLHIPGPTLSEEVAQNGPLQATQLRRLMAGLAEALRDIHRAGVVHRDLKPSNVLLAHDGPKVIDFGISRAKDSELRTETGKLIGTPPYMAPEQFRTPREVGSAADVFALGSLMVHAATGRAPFQSDSPYLVAYQVVHDEADLEAVPEGMRPLVARCLAKDPGLRPTAAELTDELREVAASYDTQAFIPAQRDPEGRPSGDSWFARGLDALDRQDGAAGSGGPGGPGGSDGIAEPEGPNRAGGPNRPVGTDSADSAPVHALVPAAAPDGASDTHRSSNPVAPDASGPVRAVNHSRGTSRGVRRKRILLLAGLGTVVASVLAVAATTGALPLGAPADPSPAAGPPPGPESPAVTAPWHTRLPDHGAGGEAPLCTYSAERIYCSRGGTNAAAVDAREGTLRWTSRGGDGPALYAPFLASGLIQCVTDMGRALLQLDPRTGRERSRIDLTGPVGKGAAFTHTSRTVLLGGDDGTVVALDPGSGKRRWSTRVEGQLPPLLDAYGRTLVATRPRAAGSATTVNVLDAETGAHRAARTLPGNLEAIGVRGDGAVLLQSRDKVQRIVALVSFDPEDGAVRRMPLPVPLDPARSSVLDDGTVLLLADGGALVSFDSRSGRQRWRLESAVTSGSVPVSDGRYVYFTAPDGRLLAADAEDGRLAGQTPARPASAPDALVLGGSAPLLADGRVHAAAPDGTVFAVADDPARW